MIGSVKGMNRRPRVAHPHRRRRAAARVPPAAVARPHAARRRGLRRLPGHRRGLRRAAPGPHGGRRVGRRGRPPVAVWREFHAAWRSELVSANVIGVVLTAGWAVVVYDHRLLRAVDMGVAGPALQGVLWLLTLLLLVISSTVLRAARALRREPRADPAAQRGADHRATAARAHVRGGARRRARAATTCCPAWGSCSGSSPRPSRSSGTCGRRACCRARGRSGGGGSGGAEPGADDDGDGGGREVIPVLPTSSPLPRRSGTRADAELSRTGASRHDLPLRPARSPHVPDAFVIDSDRLIWRGSGETVVVEPWGPDSVRVRAALGGPVTDTDWALLPQEAAAGGVSRRGASRGERHCRRGRRDADPRRDPCGRDGEGVLRLAGAVQPVAVPARVLRFTWNLALRRGGGRRGAQAAGSATTTRCPAGRTARGCRSVGARDEKLYGMGQYQQDLLDLKGVDRRARAPQLAGVGAVRHVERGLRLPLAQPGDRARDLRDQPHRVGGRVDRPRSTTG